MHDTESPVDEARIWKLKTKILVRCNLFEIFSCCWGDAIWLRADIFHWLECYYYYFAASSLQCKPRWTASIETVESFFFSYFFLFDFNVGFFSLFLGLSMFSYAITISNCAHVSRSIPEHWRVSLTWVWIVARRRRLKRRKRKIKKNKQFFFTRLRYSIYVLAYSSVLFSTLVRLCPECYIETLTFDWQ